jgi:hypothetical protein
MHPTAVALVVAVKKMRTGASELVVGSRLGTSYS